MARTYEDANEILAVLKTAVASALQSEGVQSRAREVMQNTLDEQVYDKYDQKEYSRRYDDGGLHAKENIRIDAIGNRMEVRAVARGNPRYTPNDADEKIDNYVEEGMYFYGKPGPRPFYDAYDSAIKGDTQFEDAIVKWINTILG